MNLRKLAALVLLLATGASFWVGCGGADNVGACNDYNDHLTQLDCGDTTAVKQKCHSFERESCDWSPFFDCLTENTTCTTVDGTKVIDAGESALCSSKGCS